MKFTKSKSTLKLSSVSSRDRLTNSTCMWMPLCCLFIKLFKSQMSLSCLTDTSPKHQELHEDAESCFQPGAQADTMLTNTKNKFQLNAMLVEGLLNSDYYMNATKKHTVMIAGVSDVPMEIVGSVRIARHDLCSTHEKADIAITQHAISFSLSGTCVRVVCDDTDVLVLLVHFYHIKCRGRNSAPGTLIMHH